MVQTIGRRMGERQADKRNAKLSNNELGVVSWVYPGRCNSLLNQNQQAYTKLTFQFNTFRLRDLSDKSLKMNKATN